MNNYFYKLHVFQKVRTDVFLEVYPSDDMYSVLQTSRGLSMSLLLRDNGQILLIKSCLNRRALHLGRHDLHIFKGDYALYYMSFTLIIMSFDSVTVGMEIEH